MNWDQLFLGLGLAIPATMLGYLAHRRSKSVDAVSAQSGIATHAQSGTAQILQGLNTLVDQLQEDNTAFRAEIKGLVARLDAVSAERDLLKLEVARLRKKYGANGE